MEINIQGLRKLYGDYAAVDIDQLHIGHGEMIGLVGNNGAGKTTLFKLLLDLTQASEGGVTLAAQAKATATNMGETPATQAGEPLAGVDTSAVIATEEPIDPSKSEAWKEHTGAFMGQGFLIDFLTPEEYIDFVCHTHHLPAVDWKALAQRHTEQSADATPGPITTEMDELADGELWGTQKLIRELSAGNQQKVGIIAALIGRPQLLVLDEPFNFLDPSGQMKLKRLLKHYHERTGATILVSSHNLQHTIDISSRMLLMEKGRLIQDLDNSDGTAAEVIKQYFEG